MSSEEVSLVQSNRLENGLNTQLVFQDDGLRFNCVTPPQSRVGDSVPKTQKLSGFMEDQFFASQGSNFRRSLYNDGRGRVEPPETRNWNENGTVTTPSGDGSEDDDEEGIDDDDEVDEGDAEVEGLVGVDDGGKMNSVDESSNGEDKLGNGKENLLHHSLFGGTAIFGQSRELMLKDGSIRQQNVSSSSTKPSPSENHCQQGSYQNAISVAEPNNNAYYSQYLQGSEGPASGQKDLNADNGCGFSGRKDISCLNEPGESLRAIFSDPITGVLMDDAMILPCGHSFGSGGIQHVIRMKACYTCSQPISEDFVAPNLSLRAAVQAFRREEEFYRSSKRKRDRFDQDKSGYGVLSLMDSPRGRGVQFPFAVTDRVVIKGNKRTPQRFVGREAVVTTQCLNGWYVVKTLDNAESVKLQYRSLAKVDDSSSKPMSSKMTPPNWL